MRVPRAFLLLAVLATVAGCGEASDPTGPLGVVDPAFATMIPIPEGHPGNPFYAMIFNALEPESPEFFFPHDGEWAAAVFERELWCVPAGFNLLLEFDFTPAFPGGPPRPFLCPLTVQGFQVWHNPPNPLPVDPAPIMVQSRGLGAVPVVFVLWADVQAAMEDQVLTLPELLAIPSAIVASADHMVAQYVNGPAPEHLLMNKLNASGRLPDGRDFGSRPTRARPGPVTASASGRAGG